MNDFLSDKWYVLAKIGETGKIIHINTIWKMNMCQIFSKPHQFVTLAIRNKTRENIGTLLSLETNYSCNVDNFAIMSHIVWDLTAFHFEKAMCPRGPPADQRGRDGRRP